MNMAKKELGYQYNIQKKMLANSDDAQMLHEWYENATSPTTALCLHELFEAQVERTPDAIAVIFENQKLTYRELNTKANQLANYLQKLEVGPEVIVGICLERSLEMVVGLLGILKAGGAYVPLDPAYPQERLAYILEDTQTPLILTTKPLVKNLATHQAQAICLDSDWEIIAQNSSEKPVTQVTADNLSYIIYTSGSTGQPKGVMITHRGICNTLNWRQKTFKLAQKDKVLQTISFSFDPSVWQIFWPLSFGAQLIMARPGGHQDPTYLIKTIVEQQITIIALVPSIMRVLLEEEEFENCRCLRHITSGGEALPIELVERFFVRLKLDNVLVNCYGPTEAAIDATFWTCQRGTNYIFAPIGRSIANTEIYILDEDLQLVPVGEAGELHIAGVGLARGYLNRSELTNEKFICSPFENSKFDRLYKTGDLARYLPDGNIEFLGRIDQQVKIRGFRIELGEIEAILAQHPALKQTLVIDREDVPGNKRLVAYMVAQPGQVPTQSELRRFLQDKLPEYMVPAAFVLLDTIPLNPNGKVDRRALPAPDPSSLSLATDFVAPRTTKEEILAAIWGQVLGIEQIGIYDNFFELGGHSLLATQVISRIRQALAVEISLQSLFAHPTIAEFAEVINQHQFAGSYLELQTIPKLVNRESIPLSFAQQRMWFWEQLQPGNSIYHVAEALHLQGNLNVEVLQQSLDVIVAHHEALRTNFITQDGNPVQVIQKPFPVELLIFNLQNYSHSDRHNQIENLLQQQTQRPFNFASDLMLRGCLLQIDEQEHILLLVMHHIASDGWSMGILWQQLAELYQAFLSNQPNPIAELPIQYADYAVWQRQWLKGEVLENQLHYWKQQLAGAAPVIELPTDRPRPPIQSYQGKKQAFTLPQNLSQSLQKLSQQEGVTMFMTLLAALQTLLYRYSGQEDILVGSAIAGRNHAELEGLIGFFVNTLVLRSHLGGNPTFRDLLAQVRTVALDAYAHSDLPFEKLVEELQPERSLSHHPLFQVMFVLQNAFNQGLQLPGISLTSLELDSCRAKFDLTLELQETADGIKGTIEYNTDLFDPATINRMLGHFQSLLAGIVAHPEQPISELPLLTPAEHHQLLQEWNNTQTNYPPRQCIHQLFEAQVETTPDAVAIVLGQQQLTYQQLNQRANQLAHHLQSLGVGPEVMVGLCAQRSLEAVIALLAILKAGGAYLPLDPIYPPERLSWMLEDAQVSVLLTQQHLKDRLPLSPAKVICLDSDAEMFTRHSQKNTLSRTTPDNLAYVIYTSGSTGRPKGVTIPHRGVVRLVKDTNYVNLSTQDVFLQLAPISFDASTFEIWGCLLNGGKLAVMPPHTPSLPELAQALKDYSVTVLWLTAGLFHLMVDEYVEDLRQVRQLLAGGDVLSVPHVQKLLQGASQCRLINGYGPTENTTFTCCYALDHNTPINGSIPIGRAIANTQTYILDRNLQPLPIGVPGELYIGGDGLARGYLHQPELTNQKFIPHPFSNQPGDKLYKTGDLVRYLPDGNIEFLGRLDYQVKIRGFRIELAEIEAALDQHPSVLKTVVMAREDIPGDKRLVAYIVPHENLAPSIPELRQFLQQQLPEYMVPSAFVVLDILPLTPNGKVDRRALPAPDTSSLNLATEIVAPRNQVERQLTEIWQQILGIQTISIKDNFFDLGGHSLLAIKLFWQVEQIFGKNLPLATLFQSGTIEALSKIISPEGSVSATASTWTSLVPIQPNGSKPPFFCIHGLGGEVLCFRELAMCLGADQPFYGLQPQGLDGKQPLHTRVEDMAADYIREIQTLQPQGPYFLGGYSFGGIVAFEMAHQLHRQGQKVALLAMLDSSIPGCDQRLPFVKRVFEHFNNLLQMGPAYLWQRVEIWSEWAWDNLKRGKYLLQKKYLLDKNGRPNYLFDVAQHLLETDKHIELMETNLEAVNAYTFQVYPGQIVLLRTDDETRGVALGVQYDPQFGWGELVGGGVDIHYIPGSHLNLLNEPSVQVVAEKLQYCLARAAEK
jgi:amino acid adenylation domain-containing protein